MGDDFLNLKATSSFETYWHNGRENDVLRLPSDQLIIDVRLLLNSDLL